ncbi:hypothetical protein AB2B38_009670 [Balneola sp. MJW-20]|uniref:hypothetical protein n=1 Tax=Gracilimonas aurantiaca TaxID=3234185 RepID=UPI003464F402
MEVVESYKLGSIEVTVSKTDKSNKLKVECTDGDFRSEFTVSPYEFENYRRLMNRKITDAFKDQ